jgi:hypothetical protein
MDDILIICDSKRMHPDLITTNTNQMHNDIKFNPAHKNNGQINFLDLLLIRKPTEIEIDHRYNHQFLLKPTYRT